jgi:hypothetical protein
MKKELLNKIKKAKYCFAWVNIYVEDGEYLQITKGTLKAIVNKASKDFLKLMLNGNYSENATFKLREDGDLYVN